MAERLQRSSRLRLGRLSIPREVDDELAFHLEEAARDLVATGASPVQARAEALRRFGDPERYRRTCYQIARRRLAAERRGEIMSDLLADMRVALRTYGRSPAFLAGTVLTLALVIGATTAIFSVVWGVLGKPLPFPEPERLVHLWEKNPERGWMFNSTAPANFLDWKDRLAEVADLTSHSFAPFRTALAGQGEPEMLTAMQVYPNYFAVLAAPPVAGRGFLEEEAWLGRMDVVVLSHDLWQRRFGADPGIVGRSVDLGGRPRSVVGVAAPGFAYPEAGIDVWTPFAWEPANREAVWFRQAHFVWTVARLRPGVTHEAALARLEQVAGQLEQEYPGTNRLMGAGLTPLHEWVVGKTRRALLVLLGATALVLAIACANVAHLQLARTAPRDSEMQVRGALGASRWRLLRQLLAESLLLSLGAGALGLLLAGWATPALLALAPADLPRAGEVRMDGAVLAFSLGATLLTCLLFGLAPAFRAARSSSRGAQALRGRRATVDRSRQRARGLLVVGEIGIALVLVAGAGLLARSFVTLRTVDPGFRPEGLLTVGVSPAGSRYQENAQVVDFFERIVERVRALPGVTAVALADRLPLTGSNWTSDFAVAGRAREDFGIEASHRAVSPGYLQAMGVPLLSGRDFTDADRAGEPPVILINEALAERYFAGQDPIGQRICFDRYPDEESLWRTVVGVVGNERVAGLAAQGRPDIFEAFAQSPEIAEYLVVRTSGEPLGLVPAIRAAVESVDKNQPLFDVRTMEQVVAGSVVRERFLTVLVGLFAAVALLLAAIGTYSVIAYGVTQRRREIGIRRALGAREGSVVGLVLRQGLALTVAGLALGLAGALAATRALSGLLFEVSPGDPRTLGAVAAALAAVALSASYLPARRAARVDPVATLREE